MCVSIWDQAGLVVQFDNRPICSQDKNYDGGGECLDDESIISETPKLSVGHHTAVLSGNRDQDNVTVILYYRNAHGDVSFGECIITKLESLRPWRDPKIQSCIIIDSNETIRKDNEEELHHQYLGMSGLVLGPSGEDHLLILLQNGNGIVILHKSTVASYLPWNINENPNMTINCETDEDEEDKVNPTNHTKLIEHITEPLMPRGLMKISRQVDGSLKAILGSSDIDMPCVWHTYLAHSLTYRLSSGKWPSFITKTLRQLNIDISEIHRGRNCFQWSQLAKKIPQTVHIEVTKMQYYPYMRIMTIIGMRNNAIKLPVDLMCEVLEWIPICRPYCFWCFRGVVVQRKDSEGQGVVLSVVNQTEARVMWESSGKNHYHHNVELISNLQPVPPFQYMQHCVVTGYGSQRCDIGPYYGRTAVLLGESDDDLLLQLVQSTTGRGHHDHEIAVLPKCVVSRYSTM